MRRFEKAPPTAPEVSGSDCWSPVMVELRGTRSRTSTSTSYVEQSSVSVSGFGVLRNQTYLQGPTDSGGVPQRDDSRDDVEGPVLHHGRDKVVNVL